MHALWLSLVLAGAAGGEPPRPEVRVAEFVLTDPAGDRHPADEWRDRPLLVVVFLGVDCPLARLYAPRLAELDRVYGRRGVAFLAVDANAGDAPAEVFR